MSEALRKSKIHQLLQYQRATIGLAITSIYVLDFAINCGRTSLHSCLKLQKPANK